MDCVPNDSYTYSYIMNIKNNNEHLALISYCTIACMCAIGNAIRSNSSTNTLLNLVLLNTILRMGRR